MDYIWVYLAAYMIVSNNNKVMIWTLQNSYLVEYYHWIERTKLKRIGI